MHIEPLTSNLWLQKLQSLKAASFTGQLVVRSQAGHQWCLYFYLGQIVYATGGQHPVRRWLRNLSLYCFAVDTSQPDVQRRLTDISLLNESEVARSWEYYLLVHWTHKKKLLPQQSANFIQSVILEILFDIYQSEQFTCEERTTSELTPQLALLDAEKLWMASNQRWEEWQNAHLATIQPNLAPLISKPEVIRQSMSATAYTALESSIDGKYSLREIAVRTRRSEVQVSASLLPYIKNDVISLVNTPDYIDPTIQYLKDLQQTVDRQKESWPFVACVDDSSFVCEQMEKIFVGAGFQFVGITDSLRAVPTILAKKPILIFLDLVMPNTNGYEICSYIRKVATFRDTPIIILTGNDGIVDRVRAKMVGASDFLSKPVDPEAILQIVHKYTQVQV